MPVHFLPKVIVSPLFIDYLSFTLSVFKQDEDKIIENFHSTLSQFPDKKELQGMDKLKIKDNDRLYNLRKDVYIPDKDEHIRFYCWPKNGSGNFLKVEWIPSKINPSEVAEMVDLILPGGYSRLVTFGKITRVDITTLLKNISLNDILYHYPNLKVNKVFAGSGGNESVYLGSANSEKHFTLYDKKKQIKDTNKKKSIMHKVAVPKSQHIQVEFKLRPKKKKVTLSNLSILGKPEYEKLKILKLRYLPDQVSDFDSLVNVTINNMQTRGYNKALQMIEGKKRRDKVRDRVKSLCLANWWNPAELWKSLPDAIEPILNPVPNKWQHLKN